MSAVPENYQPLQDSQARPSANAKLLGPSDANETLWVTIVLRRGTNQPTPSDPANASPAPQTPGGNRPEDEFSARHQAAPEDIAKVAAFAVACDLVVVETHAVRRTVVVSGTIAKMNKAFGVNLGRYQSRLGGNAGKGARAETFRSYEGQAHVPKDIAGSIVSVVGLDNSALGRFAGWRRNGRPVIV